MISKLRTVIAAGAIFVIASSSAFAQYDTSNRSRLGMRMSDYRPSSGVLSSMSANWLSPTIDYNLRFDKQDRPTHFISLTMFAQDNGNRKAKYVPVMFNYIKRFSKPGDTKGLYVGGGIGLCKIRYEALDYSLGGWKSSGFTNIGGSLVAGCEFSEAWYAELRYDVAGSLTNPVAGDLSFNGLVLSAGTHLAY